MASDPESSIDLVMRAQAGDAEALNRLLERYLPRLQRWAHGRMPAGIRSLSDTGDIVQESVIDAIKHLEALDLHTEGAFQAYLRRSVHNRIIDQFRRHGRHPGRTALPDQMSADGPSPLEAAIGSEMLERYEHALGTLRATDRDVIVLRVEFGMAYGEIAQQLGKSNADAARMAVTRALERLALAMNAAEREVQ